MSLFEKAMTKVLVNEGVGSRNNPSGWVNDPTDLGGMTNWGITYKTYARWAKIPSYTVTESMMKNISKGNAMLIYKDLYWNKIRGEELKSFPIAFSILDFSVNQGPHRIIPRVQEILGGVPLQKNYSESSIVMNKETVKKLNALTPDQEKEFLGAFFDKTEDYYYDLVRAKPAQSRFLGGWLNRISKAKSYAGLNVGLINVATVGFGLGIMAVAVAAAYGYRKVSLA